MSKMKFDMRGKVARERLKAVALQIGTMGVNYSKNEVFPSQSWDGKPWKPAKKETGRPLLQKTRRMLNSVRVLRYSSKSVKWGSTVSYARYHNNGAKNLPRRRFVGVDRTLRARIRQKVKTVLPSLFRLKK